ncbi:DUF3987 domain-containing protein [Aureliella helgolandensis]|uniref:DUF3987 domain-containing protein n=1 Tax=Aureliella helgolandensis TaxID=2527968 RepID=A0A518G382_9BACT|nr:YfjI family protein [Aureliella helgolandensis]QDV23035.1 hypothetical protein Q31a_13280 [Aureliella helgolandensis]
MRNDIPSYFKDVRPTGQGKWQAKCPAHDDGTASLTITSTADRWLLHCHANCHIEAVLSGAGLSYSDLSGESSPLVESTLEYDYHDADGNHVYTVVRKPGKQFRQRKANGEWSLKGVTRVPYRLPEVIKADTVFIVEGEKDAETLRANGFTSTCNAGGAGKWQADWSGYFNGKTVYILPDNDDTGRDHARDVQAMLGRGVIVELPGLQPKGDVSDWFAGGGTVEQFREIVSSSPDTTPLNPGKSEVSSPNTKTKSENHVIPELVEFAPFPTDALPGALPEFIRQGARAACCDESFIALPLLAGLASAVGNSTALAVKRNWTAPSILWCVVIAESGSGKSAPQRLALSPLRARQRKLVREYDLAYEAYAKELEIYSKASADFKKAKPGAMEPPDPPIAPVCKRVLVDDTTVEALGKRLSENPRGLLCASDELSGWFSSFSRYKSGKSSDEPKWLEFYGAQMSVIDRAASKRPIVIDRASVSLTGTIQPGILRGHLTADHKASGLAARLLFAMPPRIVRRWTEDEIAEHIEESVSDIYESLLSLELNIDEEGEAKPYFCRLAPDAKRVFVKYYDRHNRESQALDGDLFAAYSKLEEVAARIALVIHCIRHALGETADRSHVDLDSMASGIQIVEWFKSEARRVYGVLQESQAATENRSLIQWLSAQSEPVTAREFYRANRSSVESCEHADALLTSFANADLGSWQETPPSELGGRPTRKFILTKLGHNPLNPWENEGSVQDSLEDEPESPVYGEPWQP